MRKFRPWCKFHVATEENPGGTDCMAHAVEGRKPFACRYISLAAAKSGPFPCEDAEPDPELVVESASD